MSSILLASKNWIPFSKPIAKALGSIEATVMLAEICNLVAYHDSKGGWVFATIELIEQQTTLTRHKQDTAIRLLEDKGLIITALKGMPARRHFRLSDNFNEVVNSLFACLQNSDKQVCKNSANKFVENQQTSLPNFDNDSNIRYIRTEIKIDEEEKTTTTAPSKLSRPKHATPPPSGPYVPEVEKDIEVVSSEALAYYDRLKTDRHLFDTLCMNNRINREKCQQSLDSFCRDKVAERHTWQNYKDFHNHFRNWLPGYLQRTAGQKVATGVGVIGQRK